MAMNSATLNTSLLTTYLIKKFIPTMEAELQFSKFTTPAIIPPGSGKIGRFNVFSNPPGTAVALTEGITTGNEVVTLTSAGTECTIAEYGEYIKINSLFDFAAVKGTRDEAAKRFAFGGAVALDKLVRNAASGSTTTWYCATGSLGGAAAPGSGAPTSGYASSLIGAGKLLRGISQDGFIVGGNGFTGVSGHPEGDFAALVTPQFEATMVTEGTTARITWAQAVTNVPGSMGQEKFVKGKMGSVYGTTCYRTQNYLTATITSSCDINYVLADGGLGAVAFEDMKAEIIINDLNSPYKNVDTLAWHARFGTGLIDGGRVVKMYSNAA